MKNKKQLSLKMYYDSIMTHETSLQSYKMFYPGNEAECCQSADDLFFATNHCPPEPPISILQCDQKPALSPLTKHHLLRIST